MTIRDTFVLPALARVHYLTRTMIHTSEDSMIRKFVASLTIVLGLLLAPAILPIQADAVTVNINVGSSLNNGRGITCAQGERLLRNRGFRDIRRIDCRGRYFVYRGWRGGSRFEITVRSSNGRVVNMRRIR